jgi:hypothetical protein
VNLENVSNAGKHPMKQSRNSVLTCEIMYACFQRVLIVLMAFFGQAVVRLYEFIAFEHACRTDSACCRTTVGGKLNEILATR